MFYFLFYFISTAQNEAPLSQGATARKQNSKKKSKTGSNRPHQTKAVKNTAKKNCSVT